MKTLSETELKESNHIKIEVDFCGAKTEGQLVKTGEINARTKSPYFRVDYLCPLRGWQYGKEYCYESALLIVKSGKPFKVD